MTITNDILHHGADYTPYEGLDVTGWPVRVLLRGKTIVDGAATTGEMGQGNYLRRKSLV